MSRFIKHLRNLYVAKNHPSTLGYVDKVPELVKKELKKFQEDPPSVPLMIGGKKVQSNIAFQSCPYDHSQLVCDYKIASQTQINDAINSAENGKKIWQSFTINQRLDVFEKAADLLCHEYRNRMIAATMFGQGKNPYQAEIDAICELADFWRFNIQYYGELHLDKLTNPEMNNYYWRSLGGFVAAISPFNFTAIGGNLATAPLIMENSVLWKPSDNSILSNWLIYEILCEAGMPPEVLQFVPSKPEVFVDVITKNKNLGGIAFTGSSFAFDEVLQKVYGNVKNYRQYPRVVGETGGNNYNFIFPDGGNVKRIVLETIRSAFEYAGQKCSACNRIYVPKSMYYDFINEMKEQMEQITLGSPEEDYNLVSAVIHQKSFTNCKNWIKYNKKNILIGGTTNDEVGYFVEPTVLGFQDIVDVRWKTEIFGPIVSLHCYDDNDVEKTLETCVRITPYNLTGAVFYQDEKWEQLIKKHAVQSVGNFYINTKSTGSVVGQQPFGGFGKSGTNDKAGSKYFLTRFGNMVVIKNE